MIKEFVGRMKSYAEVNGLGKPTLLFAQSEDHYGICLDWRDDRRTFSFSKNGWTADDYHKLCNVFRAW